MASRLYMIVSVDSIDRKDMLNIRQVIFDRLRGAGIRPRVYQGELAELVADDKAVKYATEDGDGEFEPRGHRARNEPAIRLSGDLLSRTKIALEMYDHAQHESLGQDAEQWAKTLADLLDEWAGRW